MRTRQPIATTKVQVRIMIKEQTDDDSGQKKKNEEEEKDELNNHAELPASHFSCCSILSAGITDCSADFTRCHIENNQCYYCITFQS